MCAVMQCSNKVKGQFPCFDFIDCSPDQHGFSMLHVSHSQALPPAALSIWLSHTFHITSLISIMKTNTVDSRYEMARDILHLRMVRLQFGIVCVAVESVPILVTCDWHTCSTITLLSILLMFDIWHALFPFSYFLWMCVWNVCTWYFLSFLSLLCDPVDVCFHL